MTAVAVLNHRQLAMLRAVAGGRAEITRSSEPDLYVDGLPCCDQGSARELVHTGLLRAAGTGSAGHRIIAELTDLGRAALHWRPRAGVRSSTGGELTCR